MKICKNDFNKSCLYPTLNDCHDDCKNLDFDEWLERHPDAVIQGHSYDNDMEKKNNEKNN